MTGTVTLPLPVVLAALCDLRENLAALIESCSVLDRLGDGGHRPRARSIDGPVERAEIEPMIETVRALEAALGAAALAAADSGASWLEDIIAGQLVLWPEDQT